jgi:hypothetical protein
VGGQDEKKLGGEACEEAWSSSSDEPGRSEEIIRADEGPVGC